MVHYTRMIMMMPSIESGGSTKLHIRETIIDEYSNGNQPSYMLTRTYHYDQQNRELVEKHNDRMNRVIDDLFNPRGMDDRWIQKDHFIERHKNKLVKKQPQKVKDTIKNEWEFDWQMEVKKGGFHVHTLISGIHPMMRSG